MRFKIFLLTKDDYDLLEDYITYYARMFDYDSLVIVDNMSTDPRVLELYHRYKELGVHVHYEPESFRMAFHFMSKYMKMYAHTCDWMIPAETDEFLFGLSTLESLPRENSPWSITAITDPNSDKWARRAHLEQFLATVTESAIFFKDIYISCPDREEYEFPAREITRFKIQEPHISKFIVRSSAFRKILMWEHLAETFPDTKLTTDKFSYLHFHETSLKLKFEKAAKIIRPFSLVSLSAPIEQQIRECEERIGMSLEAGHKIKIYLEGLKKGFRPTEERKFQLGTKRMLKLKALPWMKIRNVLDMSGRGSDFFSSQGKHVHVSHFLEQSHTFDLIYIDRFTKKDLVDYVQYSHPLTFLVVNNIVYRHEHVNAYTWEPTRIWREVVNTLLIEELDHIEIGDGEGMSIGRYCV